MDPGVGCSISLGRAVTAVTYTQEKCFPTMTPKFRTRRARETIALGGGQAIPGGAPANRSLQHASAMTNSDGPLLPPSPQKHVVETRRWAVLAVFSCFSSMQCLCWSTFSTIDPSKFTRYYGEQATNSQLSLLLAWGNIFGILMTPLQIYLLTRPGGMRLSAVLGSLLVLSCCVLRLVPSWLGEDFRHSAWSLVLLHVAAILNATAGPLCMGPVSRLSCVWFGDSERTLATAIAQTANGVGGSAAFVLGPAMVPTWAALSSRATARRPVSAVSPTYSVGSSRAPNAAAYLQQSASEPTRSTGAPPATAAATSGSSSASRSSLPSSNPERYDGSSPG